MIWIKMYFLYDKVIQGIYVTKARVKRPTSHEPNLMTIWVDLIN